MSGELADAAESSRDHVAPQRFRAPHRPLARAMWPVFVLSSVVSLAETGPDQELVRIYYDFEVAGYCGLVSDRVGIGFRRERDRVITGRGIDEETKQQARMQGWKEAHLEWQNRGLGGFKNWCRTEGQDVADRFANRNRISCTFVCHSPPIP